MDVRKELFKLEDLKYKEFNTKIIRTKYPVIGIRMPTLKKFAKSISKEILFVSPNKPYYEEVMLEGLLITYSKDINSFINRLDTFIPKIDDWSICDSICSNSKIIKNNKEIFYKYIIKYKNSKKEFETRVMLVMLMEFYLEEKYLNNIFKIIDNIKCHDYYTEMAISWLLVTSLAKYEKETLEYINKANISKFTFNKMISKACDSYVISDELKEKIKSMRIK